MLRALAAALLLASAGPAISACPPEGWTSESLAQLRQADFALADDARRQSLAIGLLDCLRDPDPDLRDGIAFEALSRWLRADALDQATRTRLLDSLSPELAVPGGDDPGFRAPFAALALSEVARTDRLSPWLTVGQRQALVDGAARYLAGVRDHRGFETGAGWRHGVAHGSDLVLQLALNGNVGKAQLQALLDAVSTQIAPADGHFYVYGEPERMVRAVWAIARRGELDDSAWDAFFANVASPGPLASWQDAFSSQSGLARRHDTRAFLMALVLACEGDEKLAGVETRARKALEAVP